MEYKTILNEASDEFIERKSRFIGYIKPVTTQEDAVSFINSIKSKHWDATHNVYAYVLREGQVRRYSDDGEPQGTAGVPILEVLKAKKLYETAVAVVRYFGGIKLGAGGLVRAYSSSAAENLDGADIRVLEMCAERTIEVDYTGIDGVQKYISSHTCSLLSTDYGAAVRFLVAVKKTEADAFCEELIDYM